MGGVSQPWSTGGHPSLDELLGRTPVTVPPADPAHERWCGWLNEIDADLTDVALARWVWRTMNEIVAKHPSMPPSFLFDVLARNYAAAQTMAVRRQVDRDSHSVTMARLLGEIAEHPEVLSRERYVGMFEWGMQQIGDSQFDSWSGKGGAHVGVAMVEEDLDALRTVTNSIRDYVNKHVAHFDERRASIEVPTFEDLDAAIDVLFDLYRKYGVMLTGSDHDVMELVPQYDWLAPLRIPWIEE